MAKTAAQRMAKMRARRRARGEVQMWLTPGEQALIKQYRQQPQQPQLSTWDYTCDDDDLVHPDDELGDDCAYHFDDDVNDR